MFDHGVEAEGLGRVEAVEHDERANGQRADGLGYGGTGAYVHPEPGDPNYPYPMPTASSPNPSPVRAPYGQPMAGEIDFIEPDDASTGAATRSAGFTLLFVATSTVLGYAWKGGHGAVAGLLLAAGAANGYRSQKWFSSPDPSEKHEAVVSGLFSAAELFGGLYVGYQAFKRGERVRAS